MFSLIDMCAKQLNYITFIYINDLLVDGLPLLELGSNDRHMNVLKIYGS